MNNPADPDTAWSLSRRELLRLSSLAVTGAWSLTGDVALGHAEAAEGPGAPASAPQRLLTDGSDPLSPVRIAELSQPGEQRVYRGDDLAAIRFLVGGIGAGAVVLDGQARLAGWQIFNNYDERTIANCFFAVRVADGDKPPVVRALQTEPIGPLPACSALSFRGEYPLARYDFEDESLAARVRLEAFNPLIPHNARDSAIPCGIFTLTVENPGSTPLDVSLLASLANAVRSGSAPGPLSAEIVDGKILHLTAHGERGGMALGTDGKHPTASASWPDLKELLADFSQDGALTGPAEFTSADSARQPLQGALCVPLKLDPGEQRSVTFVIGWYFPVMNTLNDPVGWTRGGEVAYTQWYGSALGVVRDVLRRRSDLENPTRLYHRTLYESTFPRWLLDRLSSQTAVLKSRTCFWLADGYFGGWEGVTPLRGSCGGNCTHVWHYAQAHARLFPEIARRMREADFARQSADGGFLHRHSPTFHPAADGHLGSILGCYREHLLSADGQWLGDHWPKIRAAVDYALRTWDLDGNGVLRGPQWNTLDCQITGSSSWIGSLYLAALDAAARMARLCDDAAAADRYEAVRRRGGEAQDHQLFNGEYYVQVPDPRASQEYATGCHIDQVLGVWWARQLDLADVYPEAHVRSALTALYKNNFHANFRGVYQGPRTYVLNERDGGTKMITWPRGGMPPERNRTRYADQVMTGFEYAAAVTMIQHGLVPQGLALQRAVYDRYDGRVRHEREQGKRVRWLTCGNPFGDVESGRFYARSMSNWSLLLALQGFVYDGPAGRIGLLPIWQPEDHASFFSAAEGWGLARQQREMADDKVKKQRTTFEVCYGCLRLQEILVLAPQDVTIRECRATVSGVTVAADHRREAQRLVVALASPVTIKAGGTVTIELEMDS